jgi:glycosyltransferase involved in cell wall biosynthesis
VAVVTARGDVVVVIPAFNEQNSVAVVVGQVRSAGYAVVVIDDGSSDGTADRAAAAGAHVVRLPVNLGVGGALRCGFRWAVNAGYRVVVQCDADGQHRPAEIADLLRVMDETDSDLVIGNRFAGRGNVDNDVRHRAMRLLTTLASRYSHAPLVDITSGFRAIRRPLLEAFAASYPVEYLGDTVEAAVVAGRGGYRIAQTDVNIDPRSHGVSSASPVGAVWYVLRVAAAMTLRISRRPSARQSGPTRIGPPRLGRSGSSKGAERD